MTQIPALLPNKGKPRLVLFVAFPEMGLLDLSGPQTVLWAASRAMQRRGLSGYRLYTASLTGGLIAAAEGVQMHTARLMRFTHAAIDTIIVPGSPNIEQVLAHSTKLIKWLRQASKMIRRTASICSGTFLLAQAGLLQNKRAATHWAMCDLLSKRFPSIAIDRDAIFVREGPVWTSAGVSAGIDLALALVEEDCGREVAMQVARELVVFLKRPGGQSQFSELLQSQVQDNGVFDQLHLWVVNNLSRENMSVDVMAEQVNMSPRNFARVYKNTTGRTPAKAVELFRLESARRLLENSRYNVDQVARLCGFGNGERMRVAFQRNLAVSPRHYRERFSA